MLYLIFPVRQEVRIIRAICDGETDPTKLSLYRDSRCKSTVEIIKKSLTGNYKKEVLFSIKQALATYDHYHKQIKDCELAIAEKIKEFENKAPDKNIECKKRESKKNNINSFDVQDSLYKMLGTNLTDIPGINSKTALTVVSEIGVDVDFWKSDKQLASWLRLCPNTKISGNKVLSSKVKTGANKIKIALRIAACAAGRNQYIIGGLFSKVKSATWSTKSYYSHRT